MAATLASQPNKELQQLLCVPDRHELKKTIRLLLFPLLPPTRCLFHKLWREAIFGLCGGRGGSEGALFGTHESSTRCMLMATY